MTGGMGAEIVARIVERHGGSAGLSLRRVGAPDIRMPASPVLQRALLPDRARIAQAVRDLTAAGRPDGAQAKAGASA